MRAVPCLLVTEAIRTCRLTCGPAPSRCRAVPGSDGEFRDMRARTEPAAARFAAAAIFSGVPVRI
jgi:hypothetical protein